MSADNYTYIERVKGGYKVWSCTASYLEASEKRKDRGDKDFLRGQISHLVGKAKTLPKACRIAGEEDTEYGISFELWAKM